MEVYQLPHFFFGDLFLFFEFFLQDIDHFIRQPIENDFFDVVIFFVETRFENVFNAPFVDLGFKFMVDSFPFNEVVLEVVMGIVNGHDDVLFEKLDG